MILLRTYLILITAVIAMLPRLYGQDPPVTEDEVLGLYDSAYALEIQAPEKALRLYREGISKSRKIDFENGVGKGLNYSGIVWFNLGEIDSAIYYARLSLPWLEQAGNDLGYAASLNNIGNGYNVLNDFPKAIEYYQRANNVYESLGEKIQIISNLNNIGNMLIRSGNFDQAADYLNQGLEMAEAAKFSEGLADLHNNLGSLEESRGQIDEARKHFTLALKHYRDLGSPNFIAQGLSNLAWTIHKLGESRRAIGMLDQALDILDTLSMPREEANSLTNLAIIYNSLGNYNKAIEVEQKALPLVREVGDRVFEKRLVQAMAETYAGKGDYKAATEQYRQLVLTERALFNAEKNEQLLNLERKYESEKKERLILEQELALQKKSAENRFILILGILLFITAGVVILWLRSRLRYNKTLARQEAALQEQRIREMEHRQQLLAMDSMLKGQEEERNRIAKDLHDSLGGLLASVKMHFTALMDEIGTPFSSEIYRKTSKMIDEAAQEVRRVAHNMMPGVLIEEGLVSAIEDLAIGLRRGKNIDVRVEQIGEVDRLTEESELTLYRMIQEIVQNISKHANAKTVIIQLHEHDDELSLVIEDDGVGFDVEKGSNGLGMKSLVSRVQYLKGTLDIDSVPGEGTTIMINVPLNSSELVNEKP